MLAVTRECDGGRGGESPGRSWSRSDERDGGKRLSPCSAARQRGTRGSGDLGLVCDVIVVVELWIAIWFDILASVL